MASMMSVVTSLALLAGAIGQDPASFRMPEYGKTKPPEPRTRAEVERVLAGAPDPAKPLRPIHVVLVSGKKDHGPGEHDYPAWRKVWAGLVATAAKTRVSTAEPWPDKDQFRSADVIAFFQRGTWNPERARDLDAFLARGGGLVYLHYAVDGRAESPEFARRIGLAWQHGQSRFRRGELDLVFDRPEAHPIARNFRKVHFHDESYWRLTGDRSKIRVLASAVEDGEPQPILWTAEPSKGRVFVSILGHYSWTFDDPLFRTLLLRAVAWTAGEPVDRFNALVTRGVELR